MVQLVELKGAIILIALISLIAGASAIALTEFQNSDAVVAGSFADNITDNGLAGIDNTTSFFGTIGVILGVMALIGIVVASFRFGN